jgi:hypothetical protein
MTISLAWLVGNPKAAAELAAKAESSITHAFTAEHEVNGYEVPAGALVAIDEAGVAWLCWPDSEGRDQAVFEVLEWGE